MDELKEMTVESISSIKNWVETSAGPFVQEQAPLVIIDYLNKIINGL